ncbi:hypothetical protein FISHEDRAFT_55826 [Fistulina hepatica ATCC 64428]|uniref:DUF6534 domain-containing protein n=1 Tax=Fistulina hepatica ATCC 64428 TaxID=1128425 RepID=A0A0D7AMQ9_9AGAR|nr:hypothetical protein FISHEDRAFT_55826 [Fistulina hepatica ATCC 64428]
MFVSLSLPPLSCSPLSFLLLLIYALCKKLWVAIPLVALAVATFVTGVSCGARAAGYKYLADVEVLLRPTTAWIILSAGTDILIAFILIVLLRFSRTGFQRTDTVLNRLIQSTVQTGFFAALFSTLVLVFFRVSPSTNLYGMFCIPIGRIYTNTLMGTLNQRQNLRGILSGLEFIGTTGVSGVGSTQRTDDFRFTLQNIHVRTETAREVVCDPVDDRLRRDDDSKSKPRGPDDAPFEPMP